MSINDTKVENLRNSLTSDAFVVDDIQQNITSGVADPFGKIIVKVFNKINSLVATIENKIDKLIQDAKESTEVVSKVTLENDNLVITATKENEAEAIALKSKIEARVESIRKNIVSLSNIIKSLSSIQTAMSTLQTALTVQETILSLNPTTGPIFTVFKKAIKIVFLKDMIKQYSGTLKNQLKANTNILNSLSEKFKNIQVSIKIQDQANQGSYIGTPEAESLIVQDLLDKNSSTDTEIVTEDYVSFSGKTYILKIEKYKEKQLIGRAYEKITGMLEEQTAPSFFTSPQDLLEELKVILNIQQ